MAPMRASGSLKTPFWFLGSALPWILGAPALLFDDRAELGEPARNPAGRNRAETYAEAIAPGRLVCMEDIPGLNQDALCLCDGDNQTCIELRRALHPKT